MDTTDGLRSIEKAVLAVCYLLDQESGHSAPAADILKVVADKTNISASRVGFGRLRSAGLLEDNVNAYGNRLYSITENGRAVIEASMELDEELVAIFVAVDGPLDPDHERPSAPASDRMVSVDHNSSAFLELQSGIRGTLDEVRKLNDLDETDQMVAAELRASLELIEAPMVNTQLIERVLFSSLRYLADKFVDNAVGMAAGAALALAIQFFGFG